MNDPETTAGQVIQILPSSSGLTNSRETVLVNTGNVKIVQLLIPQGKEVPTHEFQGEVIVHCLHGRVQLLALGEVRDLTRGQLVFFSANDQLSIRAIEDATILLTIIAAKSGWDLSVIGN